MHAKYTQFNTPQFRILSDKQIEALHLTTLQVMETHRPKPLPEDVVKELKKVEKTWFDRVGLKHEYPKRKAN
jgi:hypothetical protein